MITTTEINLADKVKAIPIEQQFYIKGYIDGVLETKKLDNPPHLQSRKPPETRPA